MESERGELTAKLSAGALSDRHGGVGGEQEPEGQEEECGQGQRLDHVEVSPVRNNHAEGAQSAPEPLTRDVVRVDWGAEIRKPIWSVCGMINELLPGGDRPSGQGAISIV